MSCYDIIYMMYMKKRILIILIVLFVLLYILMSFMVLLNNGFNNRKIDDIIDNTSVKVIEYFNEYDNYYIVMDNDNLYLFNDEYVELARIDIDLISENKNNYDIIYKDEKFLYMNNYKKKNKIVFEYYDIYEYKLVDKIVVGGSHE